MTENNPQDNNAPQNLPTGNAPQSPEVNATMGMAVYEPKPEPQNESIVVPSPFAAEDIPQFIPQHVPENVQVNNQYRPDNGRFCESISQEQIYGSNVPFSDELGRQTGSRVHFEENLSARRPREEEPRRMGLHGGGSHRGESHRRESRRTDDRETKSHKKESHHSHKSGSHRSTSHKTDSHKSSSDRKDSHKSSKKEESRKTKKVDAAPIYGQPSFWATAGHFSGHTTYVRHPVETKKRGN